MSGTDRDIQLLAVLANHNSAEFNQLVDRLRWGATSIAESIPVTDAKEATEQAINKAIDWLNSDAPFKVNHPASYIGKLIYNEIVDYNKAQKGGALSEGELKDIRAWIEGEVGDEEQNAGVKGKSGWRVAGTRKTRNISLRKATQLQVEKYTGPQPQPHPWIARLAGLGKFEGWLTYDRGTHEYLVQKFRGTAIKITDRMEYRLLKSQQDRRWQQYKQTMAHIDNITSLSEQQIVKHFLWGHTGTAIAFDFNVDKSYISRVVSKWMAVWEWDNLQIEKIRIVLLTRTLADFYSFWYQKAQNWVIQQYEARRGKKYNPKESWIEKYENTRETYSELERMKPEIYNGLYNKATSSPETRGYFSNLKKTEVGLLEICSRCYYWWYLNLEGYCEK